ncbi:hypothetical protein RJ640_015043, partial [Escallonia rubra]
YRHYGIEIVRGRRNANFLCHEHYISLMNMQVPLTSRGLDLTDQGLAESCFPSQVLRCIHVGLLGIQDHSADRPTISVAFMLSNEAYLPQLKQTTFASQSLQDYGLRAKCNHICTINEVTGPQIEPR